VGFSLFSFGGARSGLKGATGTQSRGEEEEEGARMGGLGGRGIGRMLTMGTDTGGSSSQPPSWRLRAGAAMRRNRETESQEPNRPCFERMRYWLQWLKRSDGGIDADGQRCCQIPGSKASVEGIWQQALC